MSEYNLTFYEAIEKCMNGEGYIRGRRFLDGYYVKIHDNNALVIFDYFSKHKEFSAVGWLGIDKCHVNQKYKLFTKLTKKELIRDIDYLDED